jgi:hypothetical protein
MPVITIDKIGIRIPSPVVNLVAVTAATAAVIFTIPILAGVLLGTKSAIIKKVILHNNAGGNTTVIIGTGALAPAFVALLPALDSINGATDLYNESDLPPAEAFANITAYVTALAAGGSIDISLELLIRG